MTEFVTRSWDVLESGDRTDPKAQIREGWERKAPRNVYCRHALKRYVSRFVVRKVSVEM